MREILFRGKRVDNGEWVEGYYYFDESIGMHAILRITKKEAPYILLDNSKEVDFLLDLTEIIPETVGQYTGLADKNGKKIFEEDVVRYYSDGRMYVPTETGGWALKGDPAIEERTVVEYEKDCTGYVVHKSMPLADIAGIAEVIGSIHDNPELLEGAAE